MKLKLTRLLLGALLPLLFPLALSAQNYAYVTNLFSNSVSVIDTSSNTVAATITAGIGTYPDGMAITPDGTRAYVANLFSNSVSVIDTSSNTVITTVGLESHPRAVAITPDGTRAYVTNAGSNSVSVIDTNPSDGASYNTVLGTPIPVGTSPTSVAIAPGGTRAYVTNFYSHSVSVIDTNPSDGLSYNTVLTTVTVANYPQGVATTPDGTRAYVASEAYNTVSVINTSTNTVVATITAGLGNDPTSVAITPDGTRAYVTNAGSNSVSVINTSTNTVAATITAGLGGNPPGVAITRDGTRAYVTNAGSNSVSVIDTNPSDGSSYNTVIGPQIPVGSGPTGVAISPAVSFSAFSAKLDILAATLTTPAGFDLKGAFTLGSGTATIDPVTQPLTLQVGSYKVALPPGSFQEDQKKGTFTYEGTVSSAGLQVRIKPTGADAYQIQVEASGVDLSGLTNPVTVNLSIGNNTGTTSVTADFQ